MMWRRAYCDSHLTTTPPMVPPPAAAATASSGPTTTPEAKKNGNNLASLLFANNPGTMDEIHRKCKECFPLCFDGAKLMVQKAVSSHFQVSHSLTMSPLVNGYKLGVTYVGFRQFSPQEVYPVLLGDTDIYGNMSGSIQHHFTDRIRGKFVAQIQQNKFLGAQVTADYRGVSTTCSLTVANLDLVNNAGLIVGSVLRRVTPFLDLGVEAVCQYGRNVPGGKFSTLSYAARYLGSNFTLSTVLSSSSVHLSYHHKQQENLQFGVEMETNFRLQESLAAIGYQIDIPKANAVFRAQVDSSFTVGAVLEKKLFPLPFTLALSGMMNHSKNLSRFGIGLIIG